MLVTLTACSTNSNDVITLFQENEAIFLQAANTGDYSQIEVIMGVQNVNVYESHIDIQCNSEGFASETKYCGIFYSAENDLCAVNVAGPKDKVVEKGEGYLYQEESGDNSYYVEPLGNHFFYYEADF
jgi:transcription elongation factor Elf1